jgi:RimJ/RimL family protein N-acetyltransferase
MELRHNDCLIRPWEFTDVKSLSKLANNIKIFNNVRDYFPHPYTEDDALKWINICRRKRNKPTDFAILYQDELAGGIGMKLQTDIYQKSVETGYWLGEPFWGKGIATTAVRLIVEYTFSNFNIHRVYAEPFSRNTASCKVLEKNGFKQEGHLRQHAFKNDQYEDVFIYGLLREEWEKRDQ